MKVQGRGRRLSHLPQAGAVRGAEKSFIKREGGEPEAGEGDRQAVRAALRRAEAEQDEGGRGPDCAGKLEDGGEGVPSFSKTGGQGRRTES